MAEKNKADNKARKTETAKKLQSQAPETAKEEVKKADTKPGEDQEQEEESYLKDLMSISGHGGLFRFVSQGRNGIIVESIETGKRMQAFSTMKVSALEDISVYTEEEEIQLEKVFTALHKYENGKETISPKSNADELKDYFSAVLPEYDRDRVYFSDIKKILGWYNLLLKYDLIEPGKPASKAPAKKETDTENQKKES